MLIASSASINRLRAPVLLLCTLCFAAVLPLSAATLNLNIYGLYNTGVNSSGVALGAGAADNNWIGTGIGFAGNSFQAQANTVPGQPFPGWPLPSTQNGT